MKVTTAVEKVYEIHLTDLTKFQVQEIQNAFYRNVINPRNPYHDVLDQTGIGWKIAY